MSTQTESKPTTSFAKIVEQSHLPTKEQAIVIDALEGHQLNEYTIALGQLIRPEVSYTHHKYQTQ